ncbi:MAG: type II toxin-antitoxin system RelE/ParE family toxin [Dysgonamonadaceae bacterium]|jgi:plasmid stabilization system protein ParE|nr:type II toxin-antitoxin system RelE/ParE family toxin [Dysgonamonadaceae bacterium]
MEANFSRKPIEVSNQFYESIEKVYEFGTETFGYLQAERYKRQIRQSLATLSDFYTAYPECRHLATQSRMYRNIILDAHLIIYRITDKRIEVLDIIHSASSIGKIRAVRNIHL